MHEAVRRLICQRNIVLSVHEQIRQSEIDVRCTKLQVFFVAMITLTTLKKHVLLISPNFFYVPHKLRKVSITSPHFSPQRWIQHQEEQDRLGIQQCSGEGAVEARLISTNRFRGHISLNTSYELQEVTKLGCNLLWLPVSFLQCSVPFVTMKMNVYL